MYVLNNRSDLLPCKLDVLTSLIQAWGWCCKPHTHPASRSHPHEPMNLDQKSCFRKYLRASLTLTVTEHWICYNVLKGIIELQPLRLVGRSCAVPLYIHQRPRRVVWSCVPPHHTIVQYIKNDTRCAARLGCGERQRWVSEVLVQFSAAGGALQCVP